MDDKIFFGALAYLTLSLIFISILPSSFFVGSKPNVDDVIGVDINEETSQPSLQQINFVSKIGRFLFAPFTLAGIPVIIGLLIGLINLFTTIIGVIYIYDKIRGI